MAYDKTTWVDTVTPLDAERMNKIEDALKTAYDASEENATVVSFFQSLGWVADGAMNKIYSLLNFLGHRFTPIGSIEMFAGGTAPEAQGWLLCDGSEVDRTVYAKLYDVIGDTYGEASDVTKFKLPDFRGRVPVGVGTGTATEATEHTLGQMDGRENAIVPYHRHSIAQQTTSNDTHTHKVQTHNTAGTSTDYAYEVTSGKQKMSKSSSWVESDTHNHTIAAHNTGYAGTSGNTVGANMMPYLGVNYIIYSGVIV